MVKSYTFWLKTAITLQILTALIHSLSFFAGPSPSDEPEKQLLDLMTNHRTDMGGGFSPSMMELFLGLSSCFSLLYLLGGLINIQLLRIKLAPQSMKGILNINILVFGITFIVMYVFTFLPPIILTGLTFILLIASRVTIRES